MLGVEVCSTGLLRGLDKWRFHSLSARWEKREPDGFMPHEDKGTKTKGQGNRGMWTVSKQ